MGSCSQTSAGAERGEPLVFDSLAEYRLLLARKRKPLLHICLRKIRAKRHFSRRNLRPGSDAKRSGAISHLR